MPRSGVEFRWTIWLLARKSVEHSLSDNAKSRRGRRSQSVSLIPQVNIADQIKYFMASIIADF